MAIKFNRSQTFATNGTVDAPSLHNLVDSLNIYQSLITDQTNVTSVSTADELLIAIAAGSTGDAPKAVTVQELFQDALTAGTYTNANISETLSYGTATGTRLVSANATITTGTITTGVIPTLTSSTATFGTTTSTAATITSGTVTNLASTTGTIATLNSTTGTIATLVASAGTFAGSLVNVTTGTIATLNSTTGTIGNLSTTLAGDFTISQGTGTLGTTGVTAGTYGTSTVIPRIVVDSKGRISSVSTAAISSGKVLQVTRSTTTSVITCGTAIPWDDTIPQSSEGNEVLTIAITPISATSIIYLKFDASGSANGAVTNSATIAFFKDSDTNAIYATQVPFWTASGYGAKFNGSYSELSSSTTLRTYKVRIGINNANSIFINGNASGGRQYGGVSIAQLEAWEIEP
jgi:hypothetical protein